MKKIAHIFLLFSIIALSLPFAISITPIATITPFVREVSAAAPAGYLDCGKLTQENIPISPSNKPTSSDISSAKCMSEALMSCAKASSEVYSTTSKETVIARIDGLEGSSCKIYFQGFKNGPSPQICSISSSSMAELVNVVQTDPSAAGLKDYLFHLYVLGAIVYVSSPENTANPSTQVTCKNAGDTPPILPPVDNAQAHGEGTNIAGPDGTIYRIVGSGSTASRSPYTSAGAFTSYKFNTWSGVVKANSADMALPVITYTPTGSTTLTTAFIPPRNGSLINDKGTVYLITNGQRAGFTSEAVFKGLNYSYKSVYPGDTSFMTTLEPISSDQIVHPDGTLILDLGTLYVMKDAKRYAFPSMSVLDSWGYWPGEAVQSIRPDWDTEIGGVLQTRMVNQLNI